MDATTGTITTLIRRSRLGERVATEALFARVMPELRMVARKILSGRARLDDVSGTVLINEACERLLRREALSATNRRHFFFLFGRAMSDALIDLHRASRAEKRGGERKRTELHDAAATVFGREACSRDLHDALDELQALDAGCAELVRLRFFCGKSLREAAELLGCTLAKVRSDWLYAQAWLSKRLDPN